MGGRLVLGVAYDGASFHGFAPQPNVRTVAGEILIGLMRLGATVDRLVCAGRTDTGVHALAQVVHVDVGAEFLARFADGVPPRGRGEGVLLPKLAGALDAVLPPEVSIWRAVLFDERFDARRSASSRRYRYVLRFGAHDPLERLRSWELGEPLDLAAMRVATDPLIGEHDFAGFCRRPDNVEAGTRIMREVLDTRWTERPGQAVFEIEATSFCHQMVRAIVGTLVEAGRHRQSASDVVWRLNAGVRERAPAPAPAHGLTLVAVRYPERFLGSWVFPDGPS